MTIQEIHTGIEGPAFGDSFGNPQRSIMGATLRSLRVEEEERLVSEE